MIRVYGVTMVAVLAIFSGMARATDLHLKVDNQSYENFHVIAQDSLFKDKAFVEAQERAESIIRTSSKVLCLAFDRPVKTGKQLTIDIKNQSPNLSFSFEWERNGLKHALVQPGQAQLVTVKTAQYNLLCFRPKPIKMQANRHLKNKQADLLALTIKPGWKTDNTLKVLAKP